MLGWPQQRGPIEAPTPARVVLKAEWPSKKPFYLISNDQSLEEWAASVTTTKKTGLQRTDHRSSFSKQRIDSPVPLKESTQPASGLCLRPSEDLASHSLLPACASTCHEHPAKLRAKVKTHASWGHQIALFSKYPKMKSFLKNKFTKVRTLFEVICMRQISGAFI